MENENNRVEFKPSIPIYQQIADWIRKQIVNKEWQAGDQLPSEETLVTDLGVARGTVRKAIASLVKEGTLERIQGKGTFIAEDKISYPFAQELTSYAESMKQMGLAFTTTVLHCAVEKADSGISAKLGIPQGAPVLRMIRLRQVKKTPAVLLYNWVSIDRCPGIQNIDFNETSLFNAMEQVVGIKIKYGVRNFSASKVDAQQAKIMRLKLNDPILNIDQTTFNEADEAIECSNVLLRTDQYQITSVLYR